MHRKQLIVPNNISSGLFLLANYYIGLTIMLGKIDKMTLGTPMSTQRWLHGPVVSSLMIH